RANSLPCRHEQIVTLHRQRCWIPLSGYEIRSAILVGLRVGSPTFAQIKNCNSVRAGVGYVERFAVIGLRQCDRVVSAKVLSRQVSVEGALYFAVRRCDHSNPVAIGKRYVE